MSFAVCFLVGVALAQVAPPGRQCAENSGPMNAGAILCVTDTNPSYFLCCRKGQLVDNTVMKEGRWSDCDTLPQLIGEASTPGARKLFLDVGSNIGACAMLMAANGHRVIAFEPVPQTFRALAAGVAANSFAPGVQITLVNAAASSQAGVASIFSARGNAGHSFTAGAGAQTTTRKPGFSLFQIETVRLDSIVHEPVDLMKIDTQGHELKALQGATRLLTVHGVRTIAFEYSPLLMEEIGSTPIALLTFLTNHGYAIKRMNGTSLPPSEFKSFTLLVRSGQHEPAVAGQRWRQTWTDLIAVASHLPPSSVSDSV
jgi:FkbM family methyltransferase